MAYRIQVTALAAKEIIEAYDRQEAKKEGLGAAFLKEIDHFYENLLSNPHAYAYYEKPVRQGKINQFSGIVIYEVIGEIIAVYSVLMPRRNTEKKLL